MANQDPTSILGPDGQDRPTLASLRAPLGAARDGRAVAGAIERPGHLVVEAGTGVGKSFAYLVPAILAAVHDKKKVVISTHTIALQEQLLNKDIPFLQSVMEEEFTAVLVKGRSNYISLRRLECRDPAPGCNLPASGRVRPARHGPDVVDARPRTEVART